MYLIKSTKNLTYNHDLDCGFDIYGIGVHQIRTDAGAKLEVSDYEIRDEHNKVVGWEVPAGYKVLVSTGLFINLQCRHIKSLPILPFTEEKLPLEIRDRSSISLKTPWKVWNAPGTIEPNYQGEIGVILKNTAFSNQVLTIEFLKSTAIAQGVFVHTVLGKEVENEVIKKEKLFEEKTTRGEGGFGSTNEEL